MASITMTSSFIGSSSKQVVPTTTTNNNGRGPVAMIRASMKVAEGNKFEIKKNEEGIKGRRELVFGGAATVAAIAITYSKVAMAEDKEPERGSPEAKKKYAPVCVTMPTARICRK